MAIGIISGSGFYDLPNLKIKEKLLEETPFGVAAAVRGKIKDKEVIFLSRHKKEHKLLSNHINHQANMWAMKKWGVSGIISTTVGGVLNPEVDLAQLYVFKDLFFPDNRLPDGKLCTIYTQESDPLRGHYLFNTPFSETIRDCLLRVAPKAIPHATYAHVNGPRFNTRSEIAWLKKNADVVSQTAGPEIVLAGELELPLALIGYGIDYANGVKEEPTPPEVLTENLHCSNEVFTDVIMKYIECCETPAFEGFVYRFESQEDAE